MTVLELGSAGDERLGPYRDLRGRSEFGAAHFIVEGEHLLERLLSSSLEVVSVLVSSRKINKLRSLLPASVLVFVLDDDEIEAVVGFKFHRGVLGCGKRPEELSFDRLLGSGQPALRAVACPEITDSENLGSIMRTARCLGLNALILGERCTDAYSRRCIRVSMGAAFTLPVYRCDSVASDLKRLRSVPGVQLVGAVAEPGASPLSGIVPAAGWCVVLGNEEAGLPEELAGICHELACIPMASGADSLNVSVAAGIILNHMTSRA